jgi:hypothetical protein
MFVEEYKLRSSSLCNFLQPPIISSIVGPNILQRPVLKQVQHMFLSSCETRSLGKIVAFDISFSEILDGREDKKL